MLTNCKPDKQYSIIPTVKKIVGDASNLIILDAGCGSGEFSRLFADSAKTVYAWDTSTKQLTLAVKHTPQSLTNIYYQKRDIFTDTLPKVDLIIAPFLINYAQSVAELELLMRRFYDALKPGGKLIGVVDLPSGLDLRRFGARKKLLGPRVDGTKVQITVFDRNEKKICTLPQLAHFYSQETLEATALKTGFQTRWQTPLISPEGVAMFGSKFWEGYTKNPELGYLLAQK